MNKKPRATTTQKAEKADTGKPKGNKLAINKETLQDMTAQDGDKVKGGALKSLNCPL